MTMQNMAISTNVQDQVTNSNVALFDPQYLAAISSFAQIMAQGAATIPKHLQGNVADCMAVAMQAAQWKLSPFAVAQKTHLINGVLGYEAQLINAVISRSGVLANRFEYEWYGPWENVIGKFIIKKNSDGKEYRQPGWSMADERDIGIIISARLNGEDEPRKLDLLLAQARVRNSTLWADDPRQQLAYLAVKRWSRLYCPDVILGVYTPDELEERQEKVINPESVDRVSLKDITSSGSQPETTTTTQESTINIDDIADEFRDRIIKAETMDQARAIGEEVTAQRTLLGAGLVTELKNKAVKRHHQLKAKNTIEGLINTLPSSGDPEASNRFAEVEQKLTSAKNHLGDELFEKFSITLADMKPEYAGA
jgi:hypothetical protein